MEPVRDRSSALLFEKAAIESLFGAGRFRFETIEDFFVEEHFRALGHRAFFHDVIDSIQYRVGGDLSFAEPIQGFHFFCKPFHRGRQTGALLLQVLGSANAARCPEGGPLRHRDCGRWP